MSDVLPFLVDCYSQAERRIHVNTEAIKRERATAEATDDSGLLAERERLEEDQRSIFRLLHSIVGQLGTPRDRESVDGDVEAILRCRPRP
jgi:hypothetical protein